MQRQRATTSRARQRSDPLSSIASLALACVAGPASSATRTVRCVRLYAVHDDTQRRHLCAGLHARHRLCARYMRTICARYAHDMRTCAQDSMHDTVSSDSGSPWARPAKAKDRSPVSKSQTKMLEACGNDVCARSETTTRVCGGLFHSKRQFTELLCVVPY